MTQSIKGTRIIPIGGVGEFGANATIIETDETTVLIDCGLMFPPDRRQPGVEFYINNPQLLLEQFPNLSAVFITHAHEDHIGGLGFLLKQRELPLFTGAYTAHILRNALVYHKIKPEITVVTLGEPVSVGDLEVTFHGVTHSIIGACALSIRSPHGLIVHSGDFKVDPLPGDDYPFQEEAFEGLGKEGVDLLIMDSTNATKRGVCPSDYEILDCLEKLVGGTQNRVFLTTFSSHMPRVRKLMVIARKCGRRIAFIGKSFKKHYQASLNTAYIKGDTSIFIESEAAAKLPDHEVLYVVAGSQAEARSSLVAIANNGFRGTQFRAGDRLIFSSKAIPGNERQIMLLASELERRGVEIMDPHNAHVHTSGHGYQEDLAFLLKLTKPAYVAPIHGEYHQLLAHHSWLQQLVTADQQVLLVEDGDILALHEGELRDRGKVRTELIPVDGNQNIVISQETLKQRKDMMYSGMVLVVAEIERGEYCFDASLHGVCEPTPGSIKKQLIKELKSLTLKQEMDEVKLANKITRCTRSLMRRLLNGKPVVKLVLFGRIVN